MTTFAELMDATIVNTKRPELVKLTETCARLATKRAHQVDYFLRDQLMQETSYIPENYGLFVDVPALSVLLPRKRSLGMVQSLDAATAEPVEDLTWRAYSDFKDEYNCWRESVYTEIGDSLRARPCARTGLFNIVYYADPDTGDATYSSWIADAHLEEVAMWAAGLLWARTGFIEQAKVAQALHVEPFKHLLVASYLTGKVN